MTHGKRNSFDRIVAMALSVLLVLAMIPVSTLQALAVPADAFTVTVTDGVSPISGAEVEIKNSTEQWKLQLSAATDENGVASFPVSEIEAAMTAAMVDSGDISIRVIADGYAQKTGNASLTAETIAQNVDFVLAKTVTLTFVKIGDGKVIVDGQDLIGTAATVEMGKNVRIDFVPANANTTVKEIKVNSQTVEAVPISYDADATIEVVFETRYAVKTLANISEGGTVSPEKETVAAGDSVTIHAAANEGYAIESILVNGDPVTVAVEENCVEKEFQITPSEDTTVVVNFVRVFTVTITHNANGSVEVDGNMVANEGTVHVSENAQGIVVTAEPVEGYRVSQVKINEDEPIVYEENNKVYSETLEVKDYTIEFVFSPNVYDVSVATPEHGTAVPNVSTVEHNGSVNLEVVPEEGYEIDSVTANGQEQTVSDKNGCTVVITGVTADIEVTVTFALKHYDITFEAENGKFTDISGNDIPDNVISVEHGSDVQFKFIPNDGYSADIFDGETGLTAVDEVYTISNVTSAHTISVASKDIQAPSITPSVSDAEEWRQEKEITVLATDNSGEAVTVYISPVEYASVEEIEEALLVPTTRYTATANGTFYVYAVDEAGNFAKTNVVVEKIDRTAPRIENLEKVSTGFFWNKQNTYTFNAVDEESGIKSVSYSRRQDGGNATVLTANEGVYSFTVKDNGTYYIFVEDNAGNKFTSPIDVADIDNTAPTINNIVVGQLWSDTSITVAFRAADNNAVTSAHWSSVKLANKEDILAATEIQAVDGVYEFQATSNGTYFIYAMDEAGNYAVEQIEVKHIDTTAPVVDSIEKAPAAEWHNSSVEVSGRVSDNQDTGISTGSTVVKVVYSTTDVYADTLPQAEYSNGEYRFVVPSSEYNGKYYVWAIDAVGRVSEASAIDIKIDKTAPTDITMSFVQDTNKGFIKKIVNVLTFGLVFKDQVYISVQATDNRADQDSGIAKYQYQMVAEGKELSDNAWIDFVSGDEDVEIKLALEEYENFEGKVYVRVFDVAGNVSEAMTDTAEGTTIVKDNETPAEPSFNLNGYQSGAWTNDDVVITLSGGQTGSGVQVYEYRVEHADGATETWAEMPLSTETIVQQGQATGEPQYVKDKIIISADTNATYYFRVRSNTERVSDEISVNVKVQKSLPGKAVETIAVPNGNNDWYVADYPAITITEPTVSDFAAPVTTYFKFWDTNKGEVEPDDSAKIAFDGTNVPVITGDGTYYIKVWTADAAGNMCAPEDVTLDEIKVDITNPTDLTIEINGESVVPQDKNTLVFDTFYGETVVVKLNANCDISGLASLKYQKVPSVLDYDEDGEWEAYNAETGIVVEPNEKFIIYFCVEDMAGNKTIINSTGIVVDDKNPSGDEVDAAPDIDIVPEADNKTASGIYNGSVTVSVDVFDPKYIGSEGSEEGYYSGLKEIVYKIYTTDTTAVETGVLFDGENGVAGAIYDEDNLVSSWSGKISIDAEKFNSNNVKVEIIATDNSGQTRTTVTETGAIKIDVTAPEIEFYYDNDNVDSEKYYNADRTATIVVTERNFNPEDVVITITNTDGTIPTISGWTVKTGTGNGDDTTYTATISYAADGDYTFAVGYTDLADNKCVEIHSSSTNPYAFTIDKTAPIIRVDYNNNAVANNRYFNASRTATITIVEHNFDVDRVVFTRNVSRGGQLPNISWTHNGDTHVATINYMVDGDYTFDVTMTDMAGNESGAASYGNSVAGKDFVLDTTFEDMISIEGIENGSAYGHDAEIVPSIRINDINLKDYTVSLVGIQKDKTIDLTAEAVKLLDAGTETVTGIFDIFEVRQDLDGIYTLTLTSEDKAGNQDSEEIVFTVNRFGSVYVYNQYLLDLIANGGSYVLRVDEDLVIDEFNADRLVADSLKIEITVDGRPLEDVKYTCTPEINDSVAVGESGWFQYRYTISKDNFIDDGVYKISVSSEDATGNKPENTNYEGMEMSFRVDSTKAEITSIVGLEDSIINAQEVAVKYTVFDAIGLRSIKIYVNGELVDEITDFSADSNNFTGEFTLNEQSSAQSVRIVVEDMAGNITDTSSEDFTCAYEFNNMVTVSTNLFVRWYANKPLFWGSITGILVVVIGLCVFLAAKRKKKEEAKAK